MERFLFFDANETAPGVYDREYGATDFAIYFGSLLSSGLIHTNKEPGLRAEVETGTLNTIVSAGKAVIDGHLYENTTPLALKHNIPETTLDRIDRIVLRLDLRNQSRFIKLFVREGVSATQPVAPELQRDQFIYELSLAQVRVRANTVQLLPADLKDERLNETVCGLVQSLMTLPTERFQEQWDAFMAGVKDEGFTPIVHFENHLGNNAAHGIGDRELLKTTNKSSIVAAINEAFTTASNGRTAVANAVTAKGVAASPADTFTVLAGKIGQIPVGKRFAVGTFDPPPKAQNVAYGDITGLDFIPSIIIMKYRYFINPYYYDGVSASTLNKQKEWKIASSESAVRIYVPTKPTGKNFSVYLGYVHAVNQGFYPGVEWLAIE